MLPELEAIAPNSVPYLGHREKPPTKVPVTVPKPVPHPKKASKTPLRRREVAAGRQKKSTQIPASPVLGPMSSPDVSGSGSGPATGPAGAGGPEGDPGRDDEVVALFKLPPEYPRKAARAGKEGWVKLEFTITRDGNVTDAAVVDARPRRLFDRAALRAIRKWRFKPKIKSGKAVARRATQVIEFNLAKR
jgi:protein TonB